MKQVATFSFSKNGDMETHARFVCEASFPDMRFVRHTRILDGVQSGDAVFLMSHGLKSFVLLAACILLRKPLICQIHDETPHPGLKYPVIFLLNWLLVRLSKLTIYFSAPEHFARFPHRIAELPTVVAPDITPAKPPEVQEDWAGYLMFGRCETYKYTQEFMDAVREDVADVVFAGRGWSNVVKATSKTTVIDRYISNEELAWLIKRARGTLLPYSSATQSGVAPIIAALGGVAVVKHDMQRLNTQLVSYGPYLTVDDWSAFFLTDKHGMANTSGDSSMAHPSHYVSQLHDAFRAK